MDQEIIDVEPAAKALERIRQDERLPSLPLLTDAQVAQAEKSVENVNKLKRIALRVTNKNDWTDCGGKPHMNESGAMKVAALFGVSFVRQALRQEREVLDGKTVIRFIARVTAQFGGRELEEIGIASSDDDFLSKKGTLPLSEVPLNSIQKKAVTNAQSRALKKILGLGGMTWDDVEGATATTGGTTAKVVYGAAKAKSEERVGDAGAPAKQRVENMLKDLAGWDQVDALELLRGFTTFKGQKDGKEVWCRGFDKLSEKWAASISKEVEKAWKAHPGAGVPAPAPGDTSFDLPPLPSEDEVQF